MQPAIDTLRQFAVPVETVVTSAHRSPQQTLHFATSAKRRGFALLIAGAGRAAHLPGVLAANTTLPVIGVPIDSGNLGGLDALLSIAQMPSGVPVATVGINAAQNAALLAVAILALQDRRLAAKLEQFRKEQHQAVARQAAEVKKALRAPKVTGGGRGGKGKA